MSEPSDRRTVLVADDVEGIRKLAAAVLTSAGINVVEADNGADTISIATAQRPDLILLDLAMPGLDGTEVLRELRRSPETQDIPVVIVTALAHSELAQQAMTAGANDLIEKPFSPTQLRTVVDRWAP